MRTDFSEAKSAFSGFRISRSISKSEIRISQSNISFSSPFSDLKFPSRISLQNSGNLAEIYSEDDKGCSLHMCCNKLFCLYMSSWRCFENKPNEICRHLEWKGVNRHVSLDKVQTHTNKGKGNEKREKQGKRNEEKGKSKDCTSSFYNGYFADSSWPKKIVGHKRSIWR